MSDYELLMHKRDRERENPPGLISRDILPPPSLIFDIPPVTDRRQESKVLSQYQNFSLITEHSYFPHYLSDRPTWTILSPWYY